MGSFRGHSHHNSGCYDYPSFPTVSLPMSIVFYSDDSLNILEVGFGFRNDGRIMPCAMEEKPSHGTFFGCCISLYVIEFSFSKGNYQQAAYSKPCSEGEELKSRLDGK